MKKFSILGLAFLAVFVMDIAIAEAKMLAQPEKSFQIAAAQFLPELDDSEMGFGDRNLKDDQNFNKGEQNCKDYSYKKSNCTKNRSLYNPCGFDGSKFKTCVCNTTKYLWNTGNCSYTGSKYNNEFMFGSDKCYDDGQAAKSTECKCLDKFRYTTNPSCGDSKKIIDESSYCDQSGQRRYEGCKCNPATYTKKFTGGNTYSTGFQNAVVSACGHKDNFISCNETDGSIAYACAVDTSYKYDQTSCSASGSYRVLKGEYTSFTNGNGSYIKLYNGCDCPDNFNDNCNGRDKGCYWGWGGEQTCCNWRKYGDGQHNKGNCIRDYNNKSVINETGEACTTQGGQRKVRCKCEHSGKGYSGNLCGTKVNKKSEIWCYQGDNVISKDCLHDNN